MTNPYQQLYMAELGASAIIISMISSVSTIVISLARIPGGYIADRYGRKRIVVLMTFVISLTFFIYAFAPSWEWIFLGAIIANASLIYQPALFAIRADSVPPEKRGISFAFMDFLANLACIPAPLIAAYLVATYELKGGMSIAYVAAALLGMTAASIRLFLKETLSKERNGKPLRKNRSFISEYVDALWFIFKNMLGLTVFYLLFNFAFMGVSPFLSYYAVYFLGLEKEMWGYLYFLAGIVYLLVLLPIGFFVDKIGRKTVLMGIILLTVFGVLVYGLAPRDSSLTLLFVFLGLSSWMISNAAFFTSLSALEADLVPREKRGRILAVLGLVASFSAASGQAFTGFAYENIQPRFPFFTATAILMVTIGIVYLLVKEPKKREL
jgi:DHA1 family tetracycline resistance protein-like MFS transporter